MDIIFLEILVKDQYLLISEWELNIDIRFYRVYIFNSLLYIKIKSDMYIIFILMNLDSYRKYLVFVS